MMLDQYHKSFNVYTDANAAGNHFVARGKFFGPGGEDDVPDMDEAYVEVQQYEGVNCIKASFLSMPYPYNNWGGWYFMNGVLQGDETQPSPNWGDYPDAGINLQRATRITFWAKGAQGGEQVEFFAFGVGKNPPMPYPDSANKLTLGYLTLKPDWTQYTIDLTGKDISYVLGGFGWATNAFKNSFSDITFYLDDIKFDKAKLHEPRFSISYKTKKSNQDFDMIMRNAAFTYDNSVALIAFLASGDLKRARLIADALVYAQKHDRYFEDNRIRNAYQGGDLILWPGWIPNGKINTARMPGWYDKCQEKWLEDEYQVSTATGNVAWAMLALIAFYEVAGENQYLDAVRDFGQWVESNCRDARGNGGYTGGFQGWEKPGQIKLMYKSTEHNIDLYSAFRKLYFITGEKKWYERALHARKFFLSMWDKNDGKFWIGTLDDGTTINKSVIPVDVQAWALLALGTESLKYIKALTYAENHLKVGNGFDFNQDCDGIWLEGTAQMAAAYYYVGQTEKGDLLVSFLRGMQDASGGFPAANKDGLTTGLDLPDGSPWLYYKRLHVGATAWFILAEKHINPF
ncbi:MAG: hypothetical protein A2Y62_03925 [Candidatus Fischerbacteria bacterium RBG_13_37_8]|uniref:Uncharacterized protein n=1 Tax=Candidatus Fischerbacteria bacterium RBG_13_37_8 TaxID=1817863 RepID=A0A1F5V5G1_9BACT|nr:MAG: hypothetical protein A2Y62_03925 [Candidatus Fischerbacteria bacterium RBG_13_37_8]